MLPAGRILEEVRGLEVEGGSILVVATIVSSYEAIPAFGATDEIGLKAVEDRVHWHDLHATILRLLGVDHEELTFRHNGIDRRLTDVHGEIIHEILA